MESVQKFTTFDDLKFSEANITKHSLRLKKHNEFKKVIMGVRLLKVSKNGQAQQKS